MPDVVPQVQSVLNFSLDFATMQTVAYTGTAEQSTAIDAEQVAIIASTDCHIATGANPTATSGSWLLPAKTLLAITFYPGDLISVVRDASSGTLWIVTLN
jgi:hypothetical protein